MNIEVKLLKDRRREKKMLVTSFLHELFLSDIDLSLKVKLKEFWLDFVR